MLIGMNNASQYDATQHNAAHDGVAQVSPMVFGAMMLGTRFDEKHSFELLDGFVERGGVWIDTADCYAFWVSESGHGGDSETVLGKWLRARPEAAKRVRIATKVGAEPRWPGSWPQHRQGLSRRAIHSALAGSLDRLGVDHVDLLWLHQEDRSTPITETVDALGEVTASGLATRVGASNHPAWRVERARAHALLSGTVPIDALQLSASYLHLRPGGRDGEHRFGVLNDEQADLAAAEGLEIWGYSPLLSGGYDKPGTPVREAYLTDRMTVLTEVAGTLNAGRGQLVLAWLLTHGIRPILGVSSVDQLDRAMSAATLMLDPEVRARLDAA